MTEDADVTTPLARAEAKAIADLTLEDQYVILLDARGDAMTLAAGGSVTAARELAGIERDLLNVEARIREKHRGPRPVDVHEGPVTQTLLGQIHLDCTTLVESDDREARREALARVLPFVQRGQDLAFLLGYQA